MGKYSGNDIIKLVVRMTNPNLVLLKRWLKLGQGLVFAVECGISSTVSACDCFCFVISCTV